MGLCQVSGDFWAGELVGDVEAEGFFLGGYDCGGGFDAFGGLLLGLGLDKIGGVEVGDLYFGTVDEVVLLFVAVGGVELGTVEGVFRLGLGRVLDQIWGLLGLLLKSGSIFVIVADI